MLTPPVTRTVVASTGVTPTLATVRAFGSRFTFLTVSVMLALLPAESSATNVSLCVVPLRHSRESQRIGIFARPSPK